MRFPKSHKLLTKNDYQLTQSQPLRLSHPNWVMLFKPNTLGYARLGLMVGKRVSTHAVIRNRIKRVIRESFRSRQKLLTGLDVVVIARHQCDKLTKAEMRKGIDKLWEKLIIQYPK